MNTISFERVPEKELYWNVRLSNGLEVYEDDGVENCWLRLKRYCEENNLYIVNMVLCFRSHHVQIPTNAPGYFFIKGIMSFVGGQTYHQYKIGILNNNGDFVEITTYDTPSLEKFLDVENRPVENCLECLIMRK